MVAPVFIVRFRIISNEEKFFSDFIALADRIVTGATLLERMLASDPPAWGIAPQIKIVESECDAAITFYLLHAIGLP